MYFFGIGYRINCTEFADIISLTDNTHHKESHPMSKTSIFSTVTSVLSLSMMLTMFCDLPDNPDDPAKTKISALIKTSGGTMSVNNSEDTIGKTLFIGAALFLPSYFDSLQLIITHENDTLFDTMYIINDSINFYDTIWKDFIFYAPGKKTVLYTPFTSVNVSPVMATADIRVPSNLPENHKPEITVTGTTVCKPGATFELAVTTNDTDAGQRLSISIPDKPAGSLFEDDLFTWTTSGDFSGRDTLLFIVKDNGYPQQSDTAVAVITVTATPHSPGISISGDLRVLPATTCTLTISASDEDSGQLLKTTMSGNPEGSTITSDSLFIWPVPANADEDQTITFTVTDNGVPPFSVFTEVTLTIATGAVNDTPPQWNVDTLFETIEDTASFLLRLSGLVHNPGMQTFKLTLLSGSPEDDTIIDGQYMFSATSASIGTYYAHLLVSDRAGISDTLVIRFSVKAHADADADTTGPAIEYALLNPA
jgi:hypothetical protein